MSAVLRLEPGSSLALPEAGGGRRLWRVERRTRQGYHLSSAMGLPDRDLSHTDLFDQYTAGELELYPADITGLDGPDAVVMQSDLEGWPAHAVFAAESREKYVLRVLTLRLRGVRANEAYARAAKVVTRAYSEIWAKKAIFLLGRASVEVVAGRRIAQDHSAEIAVPTIGQYAVRNWYQRWIRLGRDIRALIGREHDRGDRTPRAEKRVTEYLQTGEVICAYSAMHEILVRVYLREQRPTLTYTYQRYSRLCQERNLKPLSKSTLTRYLRTNWTPYQTEKCRHGQRAAFLNYHIFEARELPLRALEEVEIDHCLLDVFVRNEHGQVARPWLTALLCRATRMIVGIHIGFDSPSTFTVSRALIHAFSQKDLSGFNDIENDWPCHGVPDTIVTDRGLEFLSKDLQRASGDLKFALKTLPGYMPWLKGAIERFFATHGIQVLSFREGSTKARAPHLYDPARRARHTLSELTRDTVKWIVDEYHQNEKNPALGTSPAKKWDELVNDPIHGGVRPVSSFSHLIMTFGTRASRVISNKGIEYRNFLYSSPELIEVRKRRGRQAGKIEFLADPTDCGHIWVLDEATRRHIVVPAVHQKGAKGLNHFASKVLWKTVKEMVPAGHPVTDDDLEVARRQCEIEAKNNTSGRRGLRFQSDGALATDLVGNENILAVLTKPCDFNNENLQRSLFPDFDILPSRTELKTEETFLEADRGYEVQRGSARPPKLCQSSIKSASNEAVEDNDKDATFRSILGGLIANEDGEV